LAWQAAQVMPSTGKVILIACMAAGALAEADWSDGLMA
jgi:hypothetical protein